MCEHDFFFQQIENIDILRNFISDDDDDNNSIITMSNCSSIGSSGRTSTTATSSCNNINTSVQLDKYALVLPNAIASLNSTATTSKLDPTFQPGAYDVVCGRGKGSYNRPGNQHFRQLVASYVPQYTAATSKVDKSVILNAIIDRVQSLTNPETGRRAQFVKPATAGSAAKGQWVAISDDLAREKVGHAMREALANGKRDKS